MNSGIENIREKNPGISIYECESEKFSKYGKIISDINPTPFIVSALKSSNPDTGVEYIPSIPELEIHPELDLIRKKIFGNIILQAGWVRGGNLSLNAFEYHSTSEVIAAATDLILVLGHIKDIDLNLYDTSKVEVFYQKKSTLTELFSTTLHFAPIQTSPEGFCAVIILPIDTNTPLDDDIDINAEDESRLLFMKNKWLLAYEGSVQHQKGGHAGMSGKKLKINI